MKSSKIPTLKDVAKKCGVHPTTVSKALNNSLEIPEKTRKLIQRASKSLGYKPNLIARSLVTKRTHQIGLLIPDISNQYYAEVSKGISNILDKKNYGLLFCSSEKNREKELRNIDFLIQANVDGVIVLPTETVRSDYNAFLDNKKPFILVDNYVQDLDVSYVGNDNLQGSMQLVRHLVGLGFKRIGFILSGEFSSASNERLTGYLQVHKENGVAVDEGLLIHSKATFEDGYRHARELIEKKADCIYAINDTVALGVFKYCFEHDIKIPQKIGLCGYDDIPLSAMLPVPLTTVSQNKFSLGQKAAELMIDEIENKNPIRQRIILKPKLIVRKSCGE